MNPDPVAYITIRRYAARYDVSPKTVRKWIGSGLVGMFRVGRLVRVENRPPTLIKMPSTRRQSSP